MAANRTTWRRGVSGNPHGRPRRGMALSDLLRRKLAEKAQGPDGRTVTRGELVAEALLTLAVGGDLDAIRLIFDRLEGRVPVMEAVDEGPVFIRMPVAGPPAHACGDAQDRVGHATAGRIGPDTGGEGNAPAEAQDNAG